MIRELQQHFPKLFVAVMLTILSVAGVSQSTLKLDDTSAMTFDVVSIRPSSGSRPQGFAITPNSYEAYGFPIKSTLVLAYAPAPFYKHLDDVKGLPSWASSENYDIEAKVAPTDVARWRDLNQNIMRTAPTLQHMLQGLLADRCKLRIHYGIKMTTGYALALDAKAPRLHQDTTLPTGDQGLELLDGARAVISMKNGEQIYTFYNISMPAFVNFLSLTSKQVVEDRTGLHGRYKFALRHITYSSSPEDTGQQVDVSMPWDLRPLGMKSSKEQVSAKMFVVDSIQKPSPN